MCVLCKIRACVRVRQVRCCGDVPQPTPSPTLTLPPTRAFAAERSSTDCKDLGWDPKAKGTSDLVCGGTNNGNTMSGGCSGEVTSGALASSCALLQAPSTEEVL